TPSGFSPTLTSCRALRAARSTTVTVPLSGVATTRRSPSGEMSIRLLEVAARTGANADARAARTQSWRRVRKDMSGTLEAGVVGRVGREHYAGPAAERQ